MGPEGYLPGRPHPRQGTQHKLAGHLKQPAGRQTLCTAPQMLAGDPDMQLNTRHRCLHIAVLESEHKTDSAQHPRLSQASTSAIVSSRATGLPAQGCKCSTPWHDKTNCCSITVFRRCRLYDFKAIDMQGNAQMDKDMHHTHNRARQRMKSICMTGVGRWYYLQ